MVKQKNQGKEGQKKSPATRNRRALRKNAPESPPNLLKISVEIAGTSDHSDFKSQRFQMASGLELKSLAIGASKGTFHCYSRQQDAEETSKNHISRSDSLAWQLGRAEGGQNIHRKAKPRGCLVGDHFGDPPKAVSEVVTRGKVWEFLDLVRERERSGTEREKKKKQEKRKKGDRERERIDRGRDREERDIERGRERKKRAIERERYIYIEREI